ncbi:MAG: hypothetical protein A2W93_11980 [Bacteroidetes bacterium GWF2_43_63]|nr:MAG: hypothetical protein A2W94_11660 [Bacteroidetes bacterium GWE2_42_42]OFY56344.1 MAG: hypothetical protein A2W93_11980 [Bacteroidetes bacterium GWF2_43_63]
MGFSQCEVVAMATPDSVCPGDPVSLSITNNCFSQYSNDFNLGTAGAGWIVSSGVSFNNPCNPTSDGSIYLWMGDNTTLPRQLSTISMDATTLDIVSFDIKYSMQSQASPCEGIDEYDEGVTLQYSINNGINWIDIAYFRPDGSILNNSITPGSNNTSITNYNTPFTTWANYEFFVPSAAQTTSTSFRWIQMDYSSMSNDHWGLDNIKFHSQNAVSVNWSNGVSSDQPFLVYPESDTSFIVEVTNMQTGDSASDTVYINVFEPEIYISGNEILADTSYHSYFWIDCSTGNTIPGENSESFSPQANGSYSLYATTFTGCAAQSDCIDFTVNGIENLNNTSISVFPVPAIDDVVITNKDASQTNYFLFDVSGKMLYHFTSESTEIRLDLSGFSSGSYILKACNNKSVQTFRIEIM